jgi:ABC-type transport system involved in multi-copper enzyme maturation permease subunit
MLATLTLEAGHEPLKLEDVPSMTEAWLLAAGGIAALAVIIWLLAYLIQGRAIGREEAPWSWGPRLLLGVGLGLFLAFLPNILRVLWYSFGWADLPVPPGGQGAKAIGALASTERLRLIVSGTNQYTWSLFLFGCAFALAIALTPMLLNLGRLSGRRIWALAKLSFKEAIRRRILWTFSLLLLVFLFASWFFTSKPEDQLRTYVTTVYTVMTVLLLFTAILLAAFSIPADLRNQTIHTIVTKPVQRFEIILGRFLGYTFLMTLVLAVMTALSLVYVARGVDPDAAEESYKARVPIYGDELQIVGGKNVGYEWDYRKYISGDTKEDYAVWTFRNLPRNLANRGDPTVRCEFTFDIFRTTKGVENEGVFCSFMFENWQAEPGNSQGMPANLDQYRQEKSKLNGLLANNTADLASLLKVPPTSTTLDFQHAIDNHLAEKYHFYEILSKEIADFHTLFVDIPAGLFHNLNEWKLSTGRPPLRVVVRCESRTQYLGVAKADLYLMDRVRGFEQNFFKGAVGLWYRLCLVIGVAVTCSTYLSGVISLLATIFLYLLGLITDFIGQVAAHQALGGGPMEAFFRLVRREHPTMPLDQNPIVTVVQNLDKVSEWFFRMILYIIPDVDRFDMTRFVAEGFDIRGENLLLTGVLLVGYLLPWAALAYYLIRAREVAA